MQNPVVARIQQDNVIIVVICIHCEAGSALFLVVHTLDSESLFSRLVQRGQQHSGKNCNDGNYYEELYKREFSRQLAGYVCKNASLKRSSVHRISLSFSFCPSGKVFRKTDLLFPLIPSAEQASGIRY